MTANDAIKIAINEVGVTEYPPKSNNVKYNTEYYGRPVSGDAYPWCCAFVWWIFRGIKNFPKTASCVTLANYFKKEGRFFTSNPIPGDIVFFKFGSARGWTNHVGLVIGLQGDAKITVEGNTSINSNDNGGAVMRRTRKSNIVGYGRPIYDNSNIPVQTQVSALTTPTLKFGDKNEYVRAWQKMLNLHKYNCGAEDGLYGPSTLRAVKKWQEDHGLDPDGIIGPKTWDTVGR